MKRRVINMATRKDFIQQAKFFINMIKSVANTEQQKLIRNQINDYCSTAKLDNRRFDKQRFIDYIDHGIKS